MVKRARTQREAMGGRRKAAAGTTANGSGRKRGAKASPADDSSPSTTAAPPPNGPTPEDEAHTLAELIRLDTAQAQINQERSTLLARFEKKGGDKKAIKAIKVLLSRDKREAEAHLAALGRYGRNAGIKITWQGDQSALTDVLADPAGTPARKTDGDRDLAAARAHSDGYNSGMRGAVPSDNPHRNKPGSVEYVEWHNGRDEGQRAKEGAQPAPKSEDPAAQTLPENPF